MYNAEGMKGIEQFVHKIQSEQSCCLGIQVKEKALSQH
jgi:hypothetical protein